ncbi:MAG: hypothetical protein RIR01_2103 [Bacteroidota bacterium]|jgi:hypothetical protein
MEINYKNELFEIAGNMEMLVDFTEIIERSVKEINDESEDEVKVELNSVEIIICGRGIDILPKLSEKQKEEIINNLSIY